ncbi:P-loop containing nucleoside triphosphate hydrolase protein [Rhexocercosporidium sp. MPI-PUGE-AT-0058]|nr:P-loop containing nucleoside triphosphate hydrolase protein [Rhexocercosporidium sp. MPI-PUGE-AT-0058]
MFVTAVAIVILLEESIDPAAAGFTLTFALQYTKAVTGILRKAAATKAGFDAVGRVTQYLELPTESELGDSAPASWPTEGRIEVRNLVATYDESFPPVLRGLSLSIAPWQRTGIVGRTGAGKSSLASAVFRFIEPLEGSINIDGLDISGLKLQDLRNRLCIIPQDPFLFSGTLRDNLNLDGSRTDDEVHSALAHIQLTLSTPAASKRSPELYIPGVIGSDQWPRNSSTNIFQDLSSPRVLFSLSQKIILLDEATSSINLETDMAIQRTLRTELPDSTRVVIAHRLSTIADFDNILVIDQGNIYESGSPVALFKAGGLFWELIRQSSDRESLEAVMMKNWEC